MAGRFEGLSDLEWKLFADIFPEEPEKRGKGMPHTPYRYVLNSLLYILITGCRWCDLPRGDTWASKSFNFYPKNGILTDWIHISLEFRLKLVTATRSRRISTSIKK